MKSLKASIRRKGSSAVNGGGGSRPPVTVSALQFYAPLQRDLTLVKGTGTATFTRASKAYYPDATGTLIEYANDVPVFDTSLGYLSEPSAVNICLQSNAFTSSPWADFSGAITPVQNVIGIDGATSAWTFTDNSASNCMGKYQPITLVSGTTYTVQGFIKKTTGTLTNYPAITCYKALYSVGCVIDTTAGTAVAITSYEGATIGTTNNIVVKSFNSDFWQVSFNFTANASAAWSLTTHPAFNANGTGAENIATQGSAIFTQCKLETGTVPTSVIPTAASAVTRAVTSDSYQTSGNVSVVGTTAIQWTPHDLSVAQAIWGSYQDASNSVTIQWTANTLTYRKRIAGVNYDATIALTPTVGTPVKIVARRNANNSTDIFVNGTKGTGHANTTAAVFGTTFKLGDDGNGGSMAVMYLEADSDYNTALTDAQCIAMTT